MEKLSSGFQAIYQEHPWLLYHPDTITTYLPPDYYDRLLKKYSFNGRIDLEYFGDYLNTHLQRGVGDILELGCGSGRATDYLINSGIGFHTFDLVDLSKDMVVRAKEKYAEVSGISVYEGDILDFLQLSTKPYTVAFSLWGYSYSVHHHMNEVGIRKGSEYTDGVMSKFILQNLKSGGSMFIFHPDILSDEQKILKSIRQRTISKTKDKQSSSKRVLDSTLEKLDKLGLITANCIHLKGDEIRYSSIDEALEVFLNFHMHGSLNKSRRLFGAIDILRRELSEYRKGSEVFIAPGCFVYTITSHC